MRLTLRKLRLKNACFLVIEWNYRRQIANTFNVSVGDAKKPVSDLGYKIKFGL